MIDLGNLTIEKAHASFKKGEFTCRELAEAYLKVIKEKNPEIHAYLEIYSDVLVQADEAQKKFKKGNATLMTGIPLAIKDNLLFEGHIASSGSKILEKYVATYNATAIKKLKDAGVVIIGRTNMDEFAMGVSTENSAYGVTKNPYDTTRVPGGSSGGSTTAVASNMALVALGTDTGGSCRQPASFCGVVGLKPTYGSVSRHGLTAMGSSLDVIGAIGKNISDVQTVFDFIKGKDNMDSTSISSDFYKKNIIQKPVIGIPRDFTKEGDDRVLANFKEVIKKIKALGYTVKDIELPNVKYTVPAYYIVTPAEISANLARFDGMRYGFSPESRNLVEVYTKSRGEGFGREVRRRILLGTYVLSHGYQDAYYNKANAVRRLIVDDYNKAFKKVDLILTPTTTGPAFKIGEKVNDPVKMYLEDIFTGPANMTGLPAISIPSGFVEEEGKHLPLGIQFIASHGREDLLFAVGKKFEAQN
ncbi:glutaminyl-tRNA synthase (glutamine-hydrolyzing) subunit A [Candidatus Nomurabacteria bacterium RIFCSPLOWO2_02_FULL_44_12]|uniref:Glutamyl-tRNA(Gln) amidotransferase subunit A n=1 Tax=Candidatus Nomurabacteria bacterium RIFCSPLOWO2_12_FULL_44_11 TaxID=1801796 RepID=A0A1F6Y2U5_9BACT|nr:MAG: glutaminyl-tRNA synthase (glutamine-hydrolyzing) subunit A [Candidatus Nomurabacteria bacterium RIFCSPHIGHO2_12_FULL_44_22b]OGJ00707.1 MAG: glutaminyl-tRNA synthase (glutamine-hydrolyzing) subunit A [Candidatus Nomurabacteria bacterium RIFCSPLOWO2_12_FULL_44_11]OGJ06922.1 MAG: glutaminyl-tRNA synthase (glutamine-hydrolyzing) subunit A [Candidatus Nomurabacteria bacterium RIFCSPLOWO2_02_FULL_44_12]